MLQDTVLGLQALAAYAELVVSDSTNLQVSFETDLADTFNHTITASNAIITKKNWVGFMTFTQTRWVNKCFCICIALKLLNIQEMCWSS